MSKLNVEAVEDDSSYADVCDIRKKGNRTTGDILEAFSGLECPAKELHEWESYSKVYKDKFKKAKQCVQRRISTMKRYPANTPQRQEARKKHIYPIQVAYAYGQDCLKKIGSETDRATFKNSVDKLIDDMAAAQPNIKIHVPKSIENSIRNRGEDDAILDILNRAYYDEEQTKIIDKVRKEGYEKLTDDDKQLFISIINQGFNRHNLRKNQGKNNEGKNNNENNNNENNNNEDNNNDDENNNNKKAIKTLIRDIRRRRRSTKKKTKPTPPPPRIVNLTNLNTLLQSNKFKIINIDVRAEITKRISELKKLFIDQTFIGNKLFLIKSIYIETFERLDKLNTEMMQYTNMKSVKKAAATNDKAMEKFAAFSRRSKLGNDLSNARNSYLERLERIKKQIHRVLNTGNKEMDTALSKFYMRDLPNYVLEITNDELASMPNSEKEQFLREKQELDELLERLKIINSELRGIEDAIRANPSQQASAQRLINTLNSTKYSDLIEKSRIKLRDLKEDVFRLPRVYLEKYKLKTDAVHEMMVYINTSRPNPYILKDSIEDILEIKSSLSAFFAGFNE